VRAGRTLFRGGQRSSGNASHGSCWLGWHHGTGQSKVSSTVWAVLLAALEQGSDVSCGPHVQALSVQLPRHGHLWPPACRDAALGMLLRRRRRHSYQPRAVALGVSPERRFPALKRDSSLIRTETDQIEPMKQAVGLRWENGAMNPGRLPWAGMSQAVGLKAAASAPEPGWRTRGHAI
jgi:hypothetical protein